MPSKKTNPGRGHAAGLGDVYHVQAIDTRDIASDKLKRNWIARRCRVSLVIAEIIAELAFDNARAA
jgi:hypothetical protein